MIYLNLLKMYARYMSVSYAYYIYVQDDTEVYFTQRGGNKYKILFVIKLLRHTGENVNAYSKHTKS